MKLYTTLIRARSPITGKLTNYMGPNVPGISFETAQEYCEQNGLGYCHVTGELIAEIPLTEDGEPDMDNMIDYKSHELN